MAVYTPAERDYVGRLIQQFTGGLVPASVGKAWLSVENGDSNNPFGVTGRTASGAQYLIHYPTLADGIRAAAQLLLTAPIYATTRHRLEAANGNPVLAGQAIVESPWNPPYYATHLVAALKKAGLWSGETVSSTTPGSGSTPSSSGSTPAHLASTGGSTDKAWTVADVFKAALGVDDSHKVTAADADAALAWYQARLAAGPSGQTPDFIAGLGSLFHAYVGRTVGSLTQKIQNPSTTGPSAGDLFGPLFGWVPGTIVNGSILVAILALGYVGIRRVAG
jgi:hypothetical protein